MHIDPHAWLVTLPITVALVQLYFQPAEFCVKRWWHALVEWELQTWGRMSLIGWATARTGNPQVFTRGIYCMAVAAAATCSIGSLAAFAGVVS